jgi:hypothetical protein
LTARLTRERLDTLVTDLKALKAGDNSYARLVDAVLGVPLPA